jgi:hypothetical protein
VPAGTPHSLPMPQPREPSQADIRVAEINVKRRTFDFSVRPRPMEKEVCTPRGLKDNRKMREAAVAWALRLLQISVRFSLLPPPQPTSAVRL